jgi:hypothetical protein
MDEVTTKKRLMAAAGVLLIASLLLAARGPLHQCTGTISARTTAEGNNIAKNCSRNHQNESSITKPWKLFTL